MDSQLKVGYITLMIDTPHAWPDFTDAERRQIVACYLPELENLYRNKFGDLDVSFVIASVGPGCIRAKLIVMVVTALSAAFFVAKWPSIRALSDLLITNKVEFVADCVLRGSHKACPAWFISSALSEAAHEVKEGDTLEAVAQKWRSDIALDRYMQVMREVNVAAFADPKKTTLKIGAVLIKPTGAQFKRINP